MLVIRVSNEGIDEWITSTDNTNGHSFSCAVEPTSFSRLAAVLFVVGENHSTTNPGNTQTRIKGV